MEKMFTKNDSGFQCKVCGAEVPPLKYSSRDHCNKCLSSIHIDIMPGDRANDCLGILEPVGVIYKGDKYTINYKCKKCGKLHNNKMAKDDSFEKVLQIMKESSLF